VETWIQAPPWGSPVTVVSRSWVRLAQTSSGQHEFQICKLRIMTGEEESIEVPSEDAGPPTKQGGRTQAGQTSNDELRRVFGWWESVPKVVCPHCELKGSVQKWVPSRGWHLFPVDVDLLNQGEDPARAHELEYFTGSAHLGQSYRSPIQAILGRGPSPQERELTQGLVEAVLSIGYPNMRCNNCTVEWRV